MALSRFAKQALLYTLQMGTIIVLILTLLFALQRLSGDPAAVLAGHTASPEVLEAIREEMGLNEPLHVQYTVFMRKALVLDFGESNRFQQSAMDIVLERLPNTLLLSVSALGLAIIVGVPLGVYSAVRQYHPDGIIINMVAGILQSIPSFWLGLILILIFSVQLQWVGSVANLEENVFKRLLLPTITLSAFYMARLLRLVRSGLIEEMGSYYVLTARAKGIRNRRVLFHHAFRNAMIPVVAFITLDLSFLVGGSVIVETLFSYTGIGNQMVSAVFQRDYAIVQATVFIIALMVIIVNSFSSLLYKQIDPRIEY